MREKDKEYIRRYLPEERWEEGLLQLKNGLSPQYIVGNVDFYGNLIKVNPNVLIPRFETELLVEKTIGYIKRIFLDRNFSDLKILDIGTGSGCIAITMKKELNAIVTGVDLSDKALDMAKWNACENEVEIVFVQSDIFSNVVGQFDVIISNPPYIREEEEIEEIVKKNEPYMALYAKENGLYFYRKILEESSKFLKDKFLIAFEIGEFQGEDVKELAYRYLDNIDVLIEKDYSNRDRFVFIISK